MGNMQFFIYQFAATYSCGTYSSGGFNEDQACTTTGGLVNTGTSIAIGVLVGTALIVIATYIITKNRNMK